MRVGRGPYHVAMTDQLSALRQRQQQFLASIPLVDEATPVPWCGRWRVRNLVEHLGRIHHWAAGQARRQQETPLGKGPFDLIEFYSTNADELFDTLTALDPGARAWTLLDQGVAPDQQSGTVAFWHRRQALETLVHLWDLRTAGGLDFDPGSDEWLDCLDEVVTVMHPRQLRLNRIAPPQVRVRFRATDASADHVLAGSPAEGDEVVLAGPVRSLALLGWGRLAPTDPSVRITGDRDALAAVVAAGFTP